MNQSPCSTEVSVLESMTDKGLKLKELMSLVQGYPVIQKSIAPVQKQSSSKWSSKLNNPSWKSYMFIRTFFLPVWKRCINYRYSLWLQSSTGFNMSENTVWEPNKECLNVSGITPLAEGVG